MSMKVAIDIGHAHLTGSRGCGCEEHALCAQMAPLLRDYLELFGIESRVIDFPEMSNADDLKHTVKAINEYAPHVSVSLHCDCSECDDAHGAHVIYRSAAGKRLAYGIAERLVPIMPGRAETMVQRKGLYVLNKTHCPAVLVELGFISNVDDCLMLLDNQGDLMMALALGIAAYRDACVKD